MSRLEVTVTASRRRFDHSSGLLDIALLRLANRLVILQNPDSTRLILALHSPDRTAEQPNCPIAPITPRSDDVDGVGPFIVRDA